MATIATERRIAEIPGPRGNLLWGSLGEARYHPLTFYPEARSRYGDVVRFRSIGRFHWILLAHPADIEHVLRVNHQNYVKGLFSHVLKLLLGEGLLTSEGSFWLRQRRLAQPAFHRKRLAALGTITTRAAEAMLRSWELYARKAQPFDVNGEMMPLTLRIVGEALFSADVSGDADTVREALTVALEHVDYRSYSLFALPERVPTPRNRRFIRARRLLDEVVLKLIEERRRSGEDAGDLLSMLLLARDEETGESMSDAQLRDEVMTILLAGHETTANALSWAWYLLAQNPEAEQKLHAELADVLGGRTPSLDDLPRLPYTRMVIDETLRLYPPAWGIARQPIADDEIRGYRLPAGVPVFLSQYVTHRHPDFWEQPDLFDPDRWRPERSAGRPSFAYFPFGGGPRLCIGNNFALMEAQLVLATVAQRFRLRVARNFPVALRPLVTLRPLNGIWMTLEQR